jgi:hypothetical protein
VAAQQPEARGEIRILRGHETAFGGRDYFHRMKTEHARMGVARSGRLPLITRAHGVRGIFENLESVTIGERAHGREVAR